MDLVVPSHIAYCFAAGRPIFLDIGRDRYFTISKTLGAVFDKVLREGSNATNPADIDVLLRHGLLEPGRGPAVRRPIIAPLIEGDLATSASFSLWDVTGVTSAIVGARRRLRHEPFAKTIAHLQARRAGRERVDLDRTLVLSARFRRHRRLVPITSVCLLDSLAQLKFLTLRGGQADLVFGVIASPFAAHCWLQIEDRVLNDRLERVAAFTPILVV